MIILRFTASDNGPASRLHSGRRLKRKGILKRSVPNCSLERKKKKKREKTEDGQKQPWAGLRVLFSSTFLRARQSVGNLKSTIAILCTD